jgi:hypothetical protein
MNQTVQNSWHIPGPRSTPKVAVIYTDDKQPGVKYRTVMDNPGVRSVLQTRLLQRHVALRQVIRVEAA